MLMHIESAVEHEHTNAKDWRIKKNKKEEMNVLNFTKENYATCIGIYLLFDSITNFVSKSKPLKCLNQGFQNWNSILFWLAAVWVGTACTRLDRCELT